MVSKASPSLLGLFPRVSCLKLHDVPCEDVEIRCIWTVVAETIKNGGSDGSGEVETVLQCNSGTCVLQV